MAHYRKSATWLGLSYLLGCSPHTQRDSPDAGEPERPAQHVDGGGSDSTVAEEPDATSWRPIVEAPVESSSCGLDTRNLDVLFVVDTSPSMATHQERLAREVPRAVRALATGDIDGDGMAEYRAADLHVGFVTPDLGGDFELARCIGFGDDGLLQPSDCDEEMPSRYHASMTDDPASVDHVAMSAACAITGAGGSGCSFEQPLEAALKALTPAHSEYRFRSDTLGRGDAANQGFLRADSVLVLVFVTDEDDCSVPDAHADLITQSGGAYADTHLNVRCEARAELLQPVARYVQGFRALRANPNAIVFAVIAGLPPELTGATPSAALADPRMGYDFIEGPPPGGPVVATFCPAVGVGAKPARRMVETAAGFPGRSVLASICDDSFEQAVEEISRLAAAVLTCPDNPVVLW